MKTYRALLILTLLTACTPAKTIETRDSDTMTGREDTAMTARMHMEIDDHVFTIVLEDNEAAKELLSRMPLTLAVEEMNQNEKFGYLDPPLPVKQEAVNMIYTGDLLLYGDDCLVLFFDDVPTAYSYTRIGYVEDAASLQQVLPRGNMMLSFY